MKTFISTGFPFTIGDVDLLTVTTTDALTLGADPVWMRSFLHPEEQAIFAGLEQEKRRFDWLAGRLAGKHLVCHTLRRLMGQEIAPATFALLSAGQVPRLEHLPEKAAQVLASRHLSLSHTDGRAVAGMAPFPVGVDMEKRRPILKEAVGRAFSVREQAMVAPEDLIALWTAKEAVMKVLGSGLGTIDPLQLEIEDFCLHDSFFIRCAETVSSEGGPRFDGRSKGCPRFHCLTLRDHDYVMTIARRDPGSGFVK